ncbi:MAG: fibronectin type III domain-containing protein [Patescibacteria group bacterium]
MSKRAILLFLFSGFFVSSATLVSAAVQPPVGFNITAKSACAIDLNWEANGNPSTVTYSIEYTTAGDFNTGVKPVATTPNLTAEHLNLPINPVNSFSNYRYHIQAVDNSNGTVSNWVDSSPLTIKTIILTKPTNPSNLVVTGKSGDSQVDLIWDDATPPSSQYGGFEIWRGTTDSNLTYFYTSLVGNKDINGHYFYTGNISPAGVYYYQVRSFESDYGCATGDKIYSDKIPSTPIGVPTTPTDLIAPYQFRPSQVNLSWTAGTGQDYYEIHRAPFGGSPNFLGKTANGGTIHYEDSSIITNQKYSYKVRGCTTSGGCSDFSNISSVTIANAPQNPTAQIYYVNGTKGNVRISWDNTFPNPLYSGNYNIYRSIGGGPETLAGKIALPPSAKARAEYLDDNLAFGHTYTYRVRADFGGSYSEYSTLVSVNLNMALSLRGNAWATIDGKGVGWVNFNSDYQIPAWNTGDPQYSVQIDRAGLFSGSAWAAIDSNEDYGWLSFNKSDLADCPSGICEARKDLNTGAVTGWARFLAPKNTGNPNWDGWVSLGGTAADGSLYGVSFDSINFVGSAWGGDIVGWLAFTKPECTVSKASNCTVSAVILNQPPVVSNVQIIREADAWCQANPFYRVTWDYSDPDGNPQTSADIKIIKSSDNLTIDTVSVGSDRFGRLNNPIANIGASTEFFVSVQASDGIAGFSDWEDSANPATMTTPARYYPLVDFTWTPLKFAKESVVTFTNTTDYRSSTPGSIFWEFLDAEPKNPSVTPTKETVKKMPLDVSLTVTDSDGNSCVAEKTISADSTPLLRRRIFRER